MKSNQKGSILILTLIVLTFLSMTALHLSNVMRNKNRLIRYYRDKTMSLHIAQAVLGGVLEDMENDKKENTSDHLDEHWIRKYQYAGGRLKIYDWKDERGDVVGTYSVNVTDESGKLNINTADVKKLTTLFKAFRDLDGRRLAEKIIEYRRGKKPHKEFYSVHEMMLVKGMDQKIFLGEDINESGQLEASEKDGNKTLPFDNANNALDLGIKDYVTVFTGGKVNLNTASLPVLLGMPGMNEQIAMALIQMRAQKPFHDLEDTKQISYVTESIYNQMARWASVGSDWYKVVVKAQSQNGRQSKMIVAYVDRSGQQSVIRYWRED